MSGNIRLSCARCGFTIEEYTEQELTEVARKAKRHKYLLNKSSICPACLASGRLKEMRDSNGAPRTEPELQPHCSTEASSPMLINPRPRPRCWTSWARDPGQATRAS